jgi:hypothetical protein
MEAFHGYGHDGSSATAHFKIYREEWRTSRRFREFRPAKARLAAFQRSESKDAWPGQSIRETFIFRWLQ